MAGVEAKGDASSSRQGGVVTGVHYLDIGVRLGVVSVPGPREPLAIGHGPGQRPTVDGRGPGVVDAHPGGETIPPLVDDGVFHGTGGWLIGGRRRWGLKTPTVRIVQGDVVRRPILPRVTGVETKVDLPPGGNGLVVGCRRHCHSSPHLVHGTFPGIVDLLAIGHGPGDPPTFDGGGAVVGQGHLAGETIVPLVENVVIQSDITCALGPDEAGPGHCQADATKRQSPESFFHDVP